METEDIIGVVVNSMALTFVLDVDEMIIDKFGTHATKYIVQHTEPYPLFDSEKEDAEMPDKVYRRQQKAEQVTLRLLLDPRFYWFLVPKKLVLVILFTVIFLFRYYYAYCDRGEDGNWVSKDMYYPKGVFWDPISLALHALYPQISVDDEPYWTWSTARSLAHTET